MRSIGGFNALGALVVLATTLILSSCGAFGLDALLRRASNELACPRERIEVIRRNDLTSATYDVEACGSRARYTCVSADDNLPDVQCVREPDPARWDPDPALLATLPRPPGASGDGRVASICYQGERADCLRREGSRWRWNHDEAAETTRGGLGTPGK